MMSLLSNDKHSQLSGKTPTSSFTTDLPGDCLNLIFNGLKTREDRNSFGLTCHQWHFIQNNNRDSLWFRNRDKDPKISLLILFKLLNRFPNLKCLFLTSGLPKITDFLTSKKLFCESKVQHLYLDYCYENSDMGLSSMFIWFPHLTFIRLRASHITDKGLESLLKCCPSLKKVRLTGCHSITDSGIRFFIQNCRQLGSLCISSCGKITGIGFLECAETLAYVGTRGCKLKVEGINEIFSNGGIEHLKPSDMFRKECIDPEAVMTTSESSPLLKELILSNCKKVGPEVWKAIVWNCKNLELGCRVLRVHGWQAFCRECSEVFRLLVDDRKFEIDVAAPLLRFSSARNPM